MSKVLDKEKFRLPSNVRPIRYEINLSPNLRKQNFNGNVNIQLNILETTSSISLNVAELEIKKYQSIIIQIIFQIGKLMKIMKY